MRSYRIPPLHTRFLPACLGHHHHHACTAPPWDRSVLLPLQFTFSATPIQLHAHFTTTYLLPHSPPPCNSCRFSCHHTPTTFSSLFLPTHYLLVLIRSFSSACLLPPPTCNLHSSPFSACSFLPAVPVACHTPSTGFYLLLYHFPWTYHCSPYHAAPCTHTTCLSYTPTVTYTCHRFIFTLEDQVLAFTVFPAYHHRTHLPAFYHTPYPDLLQLVCCLHCTTTALPPLPAFRLVPHIGHTHHHLTFAFFFCFILHFYLPLPVPLLPCTRINFLLRSAAGIPRTFYLPACNFTHYYRFFSPCTHTDATGLWIFPTCAFYLYMHCTYTFYTLCMPGSTVLPHTMPFHHLPTTAHHTIGVLFYFYHYWVLLLPVIFCLPTIPPTAWFTTAFLFSFCSLVCFPFCLFVPMPGSLPACQGFLLPATTMPLHTPATTCLSLPPCRRLHLLLPACLPPLHYLPACLPTCTQTLWDLLPCPLPHFRSSVHTSPYLACIPHLLLPAHVTLLFTCTFVPPAYHYCLPPTCVSRTTFYTSPAVLPRNLHVLRFLHTCHFHCNCHTFCHCLPGSFYTLPACLPLPFLHTFGTFSATTTTSSCTHTAILPFLHHYYYTYSHLLPAAPFSATVISGSPLTTWLPAAHRTPLHAFCCYLHRAYGFTTPTALDVRTHMAPPACHLDYYMHHCAATGSRCVRLVPVSFHTCRVCGSAFPARTPHAAPPPCFWLHVPPATSLHLLGWLLLSVCVSADGLPPPPFYAFCRFTLRRFTPACLHRLLVPAAFHTRGLRALDCHTTFLWFFSPLRAHRHTPA